MAYEYTKRKLSTITSPSGTKYTFGYNAFNQCITTKVGSRTLATNSYDTLGRLTGTVYGNGDKVENVYDIMSRITSVKYDNIERVKYTYDNDGNISKIDDKFTNIVTTFRYDSIKRPISMKASNGYSTEIRYDDKNRVESTAQTIGTRAYNTEYTYNNTGIISGVESSYGEYKVVNSYDWDYLNRITYRCVEVYTEENGWEEIGWQNITYKPGKLAGSTISLVSALDTNSNGFQYTYDDRGNIKQIKNHGVVEATYTYDQYDRLISETANGVTTTWTYDSNGNILTRTSGGTTVKYTYGDSTWKDLLTNYNGQVITYDNIGNPLTWGNTTYTWDAGRRLMTLNKLGVNPSFTYNIDGYRTKKAVNGVTTEYYLDGDRIVGLKKGTDELFFIYDEKGYSIGFYYNGEPYIYVKNLQGDVIGIVDKTYDMVVTYSYDAWGKPLSVGGDLASTLGKLNPFRYRGYVYDDETGLYYVCSRYYDPEVGRWINVDNQIAGVGGEVLGYNMFAYCMNNPVNMSDPTGNWPSWSNLLKGSAWLAVGITAVCVGVSVLTCGVATPAMVAVATVTVGAGALTAINGAAEIGEAFTGDNVVRDTVFNGNQKAYDAYANTTAAVAEVGTAVCGGWLKSPSTQTKIADKTLQNVIDNPNSVTKLSTDKFHKIANKSSWEFKPTQNNKGYRALKGDMSIRYNMNGTRFDDAHFGGSPYWVISSAKNGTIKIMMP